MGLFDRRDTAGAFEDLLDQEFAAVRDAEFDRLTRIAAQKERLIAGLGAGNVEAAALAVLQRKARRNQALLNAAGNGVRRAMARLAAQGSDAPLQVYGRDGKIHGTPQQARQLAHKA